MITRNSSRILIVIPFQYSCRILIVIPFLLHLVSHGRRRSVGGCVRENCVLFPEKWPSDPWSDQPAGGQFLLLDDSTETSRHCRFQQDFLHAVRSLGSSHDWAHPRESKELTDKCLMATRHPASRPAFCSTHDRKFRGVAHHSSGVGAGRFSAVQNQASG